MDDDAKYVSVDKLPDDPLKMPPPYWRTGGAWFQIEDSLARLLEMLHDLLPLHAQIDNLLDGHYAKYPREEDSESDRAMQEFSDICDPLWELEHKIMMKCELAILMSAIQTEETINQFCVFNLPKELVETLERLSPAEKLTAALSHLNKNKVRASAVYHAVTKLSSWRNSFAHGHCVDRPVKILRHNHLISPNEYPGLPDSVASVFKYVSSYIRVVEHLARMSKNPYTSTASGTEDFKNMLRDVNRFKFHGGSLSYDIQLLPGKADNRATNSKKDKKRINDA